jgi:hypothetical protein
VKLSSWPEIGLDGDVLLTPYVPEGITGYDDDDDDDDDLTWRAVPFWLFLGFDWSYFTEQSTSSFVCRLSLEEFS